MANPAPNVYPNAVRGPIPSAGRGQAAPSRAAASAMGRKFCPDGCAQVARARTRGGRHSGVKCLLPGVRPGFESKLCLFPASLCTSGVFICKGDDEHCCLWSCEDYMRQELRTIQLSAWNQPNQGASGWTQQPAQACWVPCTCASRGLLRDRVHVTPY
ncbi:uncharacterized protein LOC144293881 isoform X2 [Canis aureus]